MTLRRYVCHILHIVCEVVQHVVTKSTACMMHTRKPPGNPWGDPTGWSKRSYGEKWRLKRSCGEKCYQKRATEHVAYISKLLFQKLATVNVVLIS